MRRVQDLEAIIPARTFASTLSRTLKPRSVSAKGRMGKSRYIETSEPWIQDALGRQEFKLGKVGAEHHPADMFTKHVLGSTLERHLRIVKGWARVGGWRSMLAQCGWVVV